MNDELTTRLTRQLHDQVDDWHATPLTLDEVRGRARSIRRTRRVVAGGTVAAVLAIAAPLAITASGGLDARPDRSLPPATSTPSEAVDSADPEPQGSGVGIPYLEGRTLTMPDGSQVDLPRAYDDLVVLGDRMLAVHVDTDDGSATLDLVADGDVLGSTELASQSVVANADGTAVAYVRAGGELVVDTGQGQTSSPTPSSTPHLLGEFPGTTPTAFAGGPVCTDEPASCVVHLDSSRGAPVVVDMTGSRTLDGLAVTDATTDGRVAVRTTVDDLEPGSCSEVRAGRDVIFETCDFSLGRFSPGGDLLSAHEDYLDGIGAQFVAVLDAGTGEELARLEPGEGFVGTVAWEDDSHLLAVVHDWSARTWQVERIGADGSTSTVLGPVEGDEMEPPWRLLGR